jgi:hypothetical protein
MRGGGQDFDTILFRDMAHSHSLSQVFGAIIKVWQNVGMEVNHN